MLISEIQEKPIVKLPPQSPVEKAVTKPDAKFEYLLLLSPNGFLRERIITEKKYFSEVYGNSDAAHSLPHITLANFILSNRSEEIINQLLKTISQNVNKIKVVLENYNWFPHHTIFIDVKYKADIKQLVRKITQSIKRHIKADNDYSPRFILSPHLTLCKRLNLYQYEKSQVEYKGQRFSDEFTANEMLLLKQPITEPGSYKIAGRFEFENPEVCDTTTQLSLF